MKRIAIFLTALLCAAPAFAADLVTQICVTRAAQKVYCQQNTFFGVTDAEAKALQSTGMQQLNAASQRQNRNKCNGCDWAIEWTWADSPTIVTENMSFMGVNKTLRESVRWLDDRVTAAEINRQRGKVKPWGN
jgi:hypothetical protein